MRNLVAFVASLVAVSAAAQPAPAVEAEPPIIWLQRPPGTAPVVPEPVPEPVLLTLYLPPPPSPTAVALPPPARALLQRAIDDGSPESFAALSKLARRMYPDGGGQIDALAAENDARTAERRAAEARQHADALAAATFLENWKGQAEIGGSFSTGNSETRALYGALKLDREGLDWRHSLNARADFQRSDGEQTVDKYLASYQPQYKLHDGLYVFGLAQFDHDRFLGYGQRYTAGPGVGYTLFPGPRLRVDLEGGPAGRRTVFVDAGSRTTVAGRGSVNIAWKPGRSITFTSNTAAFYETGNTSLSSTSSLDTRLFGPLKARLSYNLSYEQDTPDVSRSINTLSRASLVYDF